MLEPVLCISCDEIIGTTHSITKADREAMKSDDLMKREFKADKLCEK